MPADATVLVIEDDAETRRLMRRVLEEAAFAVVTEPSGERGLAYLAAHPVDCALVDYRLLDMDGLSCLREIRGSHPQLPTIMVTGAGSQEIAVEAMKLGAADYVVKHRAYLRTVPGIVRAALGRSRLRGAADDGRRAERAVPAAADDVRARYRHHGIIGDSQAMARVVWNADRVARSNVSVLLEGATGTGKELLARAIHAESLRATQPFLAQNCAAIPDTLLETELVGHGRGAFTGAERARPGLFVDADGGTLVLDEVGEMSAAMQAMLLRVLQDGVVRPVGGSTERRVDVRVVAATNRNLEAAERRGAFRSDLLYRLRGFTIRLPSLRERREDVPHLADHFLARWAALEGVSAPGFDARALACLASYAWPGNVRELEHEIHRLVLCSDDGRRITPELLSPDILTGAPEVDERPLREIVQEVEAATIEERLRRHRYHRTRTAHSLGVTREWLWAKMRKLGLAGRDPRAAEDDSEDDDGG
jgi:DNA-binding NtrC family response regulator